MSTAFDPRCWIHTLRHRAKVFLGAQPGLFVPLFRHRAGYEDLLVTNETDLCIDGFPRSANSFAVGAVQHAQPTLIEIAHHTHVPANPMQACEWGIPTVVLIRNPYDAVVSIVALQKEVRDDASPSPVFVRDWLHAWRVFYRALGPYRERGDLLVAPFSVVIQGMGRVIEHVNTHFRTDFAPFTHTEAAVAAMHEARGVHAGPSDRRDRLKAETRAAFDDALDDAERRFELRNYLKRRERMGADEYGSRPVPGAPFPGIPNRCALSFGCFEIISYRAVPNTVPGSS